MRRRKQSEREEGGGGERKEEAASSEPPVPHAPDASSAAPWWCWGMRLSPFQRRLYASLLLLRAVLALLPLSYLHPDEFHQNQEVTAADALGCKTVLPWEYQRAFPVRSMIFPFLSSAAPLWLVRAADAALGGGVLAGGVAAFLAPRVVMLALSMATDAMMARVCARCGFPAAPAVLVYASSWPALVMVPRPFSNSAEAFLLALCVWALVDVRPRQGVSCSAGARNFLLGVTSCAAVFVRFTFVAFVPALLVYLVADVDRLLHVQVLRAYRDRRSRDQIPPEERMFGFTPEGSWQRLPVLPRAARAIRAARAATEFFLGASLAFLGAVMADSVYFGALSVTIHGGRPAALAQVLSPAHWRLLEFKGSAVLAPLHNFLYNADPENLARHGTHPLWLHACVNLPLLLGPLALLVVRRRLWTLSPSAAVDSAMDGMTGGGAHRFVRPRPLDEALEGVLPRRVAVLLLALCASYLGALSLAPHQEARFLLPLVAPLCLLYSSVVAAHGRRSPRGRRVVTWAVWNAAMVLVMGVLHQGGVGRAALDLRPAAVAAGRSASLPGPVPARGLVVDAFFYDTYTVPRSLVCARDGDAVEVRVHDVSGPPGNLLDEVRRSVQVAAAGKEERAHRALVVAPASLTLGWPHTERLRLAPRHSFFPHLSLEHGLAGNGLAAVLDSMRLRVWEYEGPRAAAAAAAASH